MIGVMTLLVTASDIFGEMQSALNVIWKAEPGEISVSRLNWVRNKPGSGRLARLSADRFSGRQRCNFGFGRFLNAHLPFAEIPLAALNEPIGLILVAALFPAIHKVTSASVGATSPSVPW